MSSNQNEAERLKLITDHQRSLYAYILSLVSNREVADEVLQETNLVLCRKIREFDGRAKFITWACRIAQLQVMAAVKRSRRQRVTFMDDNLLQDLAGRAAANALRSDGDLERLVQCMEELPPHSREMIDLRYAPGGSVGQVARHLQRPAGSVRVTLHRVRHWLLECVQRKRAEEGTGS